MHPAFPIRFSGLDRVRIFDGQTVRHWNEVWGVLVELDVSVVSPPRIPENALDMSDAPKRIAPQLTPENEFFWTAGANGELRFKRCADCAHYIHPPAPYCAECLGKNIEIVGVSGRAVIGGFTINYQQWLPSFPPPYVIAIVEIEEAPYVRLTTNIVGCDPADVRIGMPVEVVFEPCEDTYLPLFRPVKA